MKHPSMWVHLLAVAGVMHFMSTHTLEVFILMVIAYEVGLDIPALDRLFEYNQKFVKFLQKKLDKRGK